MSTEKLAAIVASIPFTVVAILFFFHVLSVGVDTVAGFALLAWACAVAKADVE